MLGRQRTWWRGRALALLLGLVASAGPAAAQVAVIVHPSVPAEAIERGMLLDIYAGDVKAWSNGQPVVVIDLEPRGEVKDVFYRYLGRSPSRMKSIWLRRKLLGEGEPPEAMTSQEALVERVAATPGAIGFVDAHLVNGADDVKVLAQIPLDEES